jgi:hypothetical protein
MIYWKNIILFDLIGAHSKEFAWSLRGDFELGLLNNVRTGRLTMVNLDCQLD